MLLGVIADDFTGASDIASTLAKGGLATTQYLGIPGHEADRSCEAGVVALKTRSIASDEAVSQSLAALRWLQGQGCRQFVFKYCSTFDSTPDGNIGHVGEALAIALDARGVVACPAFPATGRTVFQGHLFVGDRLLSESSLRNHPLNPMTDSDLRRWLRRQTAGEVGLVTHAVVARGASELARALSQCADRGERLVIVDAVDEGDLMAIGEACADAPLVTGGSGVALGLPANFAARGLASAARKALPGVRGPAVVLAGSCSARTLEQVRYHERKHPSLALDASAIIDGRTRPSHAVEFVLAHPGLPLVYSTADASSVTAMQRQHGASEVAGAVERFFAAAAVALVAQGMKRIVIAGGETSGAVVSALGLRSLEIGPEIDPGVPALFNRDGQGLGLALKSGNFGRVEFFERAASTLEIGAP